jgi:ribonuclease P/MRP protein subunit POP1
MSKLSFRHRFPPKIAHLEYKEESPVIYSSTELARSDLWEQDIRKTLSKPRYTKKDIDDRRSKVSGQCPSDFLLF